MSCLFVLLHVLPCLAQFFVHCPNEYCHVATFGGSTLYRVKINGSAWPAGNLQLITDDVIHSTCAAATGVPPPCMGGNEHCRYVDGSVCDASVETGCEEPLLATAMELGCSGLLDAACSTYFFSFWTWAGLWMSMGGRYEGGHSIGILGTHEHRQALQPGNLFSADGTWWGAGNCTAHFPPCAAAPPPGVTSTRTLAHFALCRGRVVCRCVHGECDIASPDGNCRLDSCKGGWSGLRCDEPCTQVFCSDRGSVVYTNKLNQCACDCPAPWGPGSTGGCNQCSSTTCAGVTYVETLLVSTAAPPIPASVDVGDVLLVSLEARDTASQAVDASIDADLVVELITGAASTGAAQSGAPLTVAGAKLANGLGSVAVRFGSTCAACTLVISSAAGFTPTLTHAEVGPVEVRSKGDTLRAGTALKETFVNTPFTFALRAVDGATGAVSTSVNPTVEVTLELGPLTLASASSISPASLEAGPSGTLTPTLVRGQTAFILQLTAGCLDCFLVFSESGTQFGLADLKYGPFVCSGVTVELAFGSTSTPFTRSVRTLVPFPLEIRALDVNGDLVVSEGGEVTLAKETNPRGGVLDNYDAGGVRVPLAVAMVAGVAGYRLAFGASCGACVLVATHSTAAGGVGFPSGAIRVSGPAVELRILSVTPTTVKAMRSFDVEVAAVDSAGVIDALDTSVVEATLNPGGGNGGGGTLVEKNGTLSRGLVRGAAVFTFWFTRTCAACVVTFSDAAAALPAAATPGIAVVRAAEKLVVAGGYPSTTPRGQSFAVTLNAVDEFDALDASETGIVVLELLPNGGNGDGGTVTSPPAGNSVALVGGTVTFAPTFSDACSACVLQFTLLNTGIAPAVAGPIRVTTAGTKLRVTPPLPAVVGVNEQMNVLLQVVDDADNVDYTPRGSVQMSWDSSGLNGGGGVLLNGGSPSDLASVLVQGSAVFAPSFTLPCAACALTFKDLQTTLPTLVTQPIIVTGQPVSLVVKTPAWARQADLNVVAAEISVRDYLEITVQMLDAAGYVAMVSNVTVTCSLAAGGGNGDGGVLSNTDPATGGQLPLPAAGLAAGAASFRLQFGAACSACRLAFAASLPGVAAAALPPVRVLSAAAKLALAGAPGPPATKGLPYPLPLAVVDTQGNTAEGWTRPVVVTLLPNGGNGGGGAIAENGALEVAVEFANGTGSAALVFSRACDACYLQAAAAEVADLTIGPVQVTTTTAALSAALKGGGVVHDVPCSISVSAVDSHGDVNRLDTAEVTLRPGRMAAGGRLEVDPSSPILFDGAPTLRAPLADGVIELHNLRVSSPCGSCVIVFGHENDTVQPFHLRMDGGGAFMPVHVPDATDADQGDGFDERWLLFIVPIVLSGVVGAGVVTAAKNIVAAKKAAQGNAADKAKTAEEKERRRHRRRRNEEEKEAESLSSGVSSTDDGASRYCRPRPTAETLLSRTQRMKLNPIDSVFAPETSLRNMYSSGELKRQPAGAPPASASGT
ncbi:hypothetical protein DIPPA_06281 [Diplonema papillatum]|nr:hypothetical protein DIPPA_06281 [Diplonema papillatum]KAJ9463596.1 hypothetical protein DIPPA_06281 [Diplonema papillatum]